MNKVFSKVSLKRKAYGSKVNLKRNYHLLFQSSFCIPTVYIVFSRFHTVGGTWGCQTPTFPLMKSTVSHGSFNSHLYQNFLGWEIFTSNYTSSLSCEVPILVMWLFFNFETSSFSCWSGILGSSKSYHYLLQVCGYTSLSLFMKLLAYRTLCVL